ncbi:hypothetical protein Tco_0901007 [Tanacetum coccineum]
MQYWECLLLELSTGDTMTSDRSLNKYSTLAAGRNRSIDPWEGSGSFTVQFVQLPCNLLHIRKDPSFFLTNRTGAPQGKELGLMKPLSVQHQVSNRFEIPLVEWVVYPKKGVLRKTLGNS